MSTFTSKNQITKLQILIKSHYLQHLINNLFIIIVALFVFFKTCIQTDAVGTYKTIIGSTAFLLSILYAILFLKNSYVCCKIMFGYYRIETSPVHSLKFRCPYASNDIKLRVLELNNMSITITDEKAQEFNIGDTALIVFINGRHYPILISNIGRNSLMEHN